MATTTARTPPALAPLAVTLVAPAVNLRYPWVVSRRRAWCRTIDRIGQRYNQLVVIDKLPSRLCGAAYPSKQAWWQCRCDCGRMVAIRASNLVSGQTKSCGCRRAAAAIANGRARMTHGMSRSPEFNAWHKMLDRCLNSRSRWFRHYGGRGIRVCDQWRDSFVAFLTDMGRRPDPKLSLDRIDNDGHYEPGNCRWATASEQVKNRRRLSKPIPPPSS